MWTGSLTEARRASVLAVAAVVALAAPMSAQTDTAFETAMAEALDGAGQAASLLRCTALFRAFRLYAGDETELGATAASRETDLAVAGVVIWQNETGAGDLDTAFATIVPIVGDATDLFLARMVANQEDAGSVFDPGLEPELAFCDTLHGEIAAGLGE